MPASMFTPRPYQIELVERALKRNTIACLNSTVAKSFVWKTYLREILGNNFRVTREDGKETNAFVLFNSDHLVREYGVTLNTHLDMSVLSLPTEKALQLNPEEWENILSDKKIIVTTPKVLASALTKSSFESSLASVLVFDECQAVLQEESDYRKIVRIFKESDCRPYILGLTCSLLKEDSSAADLENAIKSMEELLGCKAETATDLIALDGCSPSQPDEKIVLCGSKKIPLEDEEDAKVFDASKLSAEIHEILGPAIEWLKICQVTSATGIVAANIIFKSKEAQNASEEETSSDEDSDMEEDTSVVKNCDNEAAAPLSCEDKPLSTTTSGQREVDINALVATYLTVLSQVLLVLDVLGLWCAHRLIILLLKQLQKNIRVQESLTKCADDRSKWKYLLLRYADSHLRTVYTLCQTHLGHQKKIDLLLVTPKVDRLLQVLKEYRPPAEPDKKNESSKVSRYNDRSEANYVSWWQDSDAEEDDEEEQMINRGNERNDNNWNEKDEEANSGTTRTRQYHHANTLCGIVFVKEKYVAVMLQRLLKEVSKEDSDLWHISSAHITSLASTETSSNILEKANVTQDMYNNTTNTEKLKQEEVLRSFRSHEVNVLVSTNCMEEYAEIPKCNLVLRFDVPTTYKSYILSKSRVRSTNSTYMMLVHEGEKPDFLLRLQEYKKIEKVLQDSTYEIQAKKTAPADFDYFDVKEDDLDDEFELARAPPYYSGPNTCVTLDSAIHIINRYCSRLPSDPFTHLSPRCEVMEVSNSQEHSSDSLFSTATSDKAYHGILQLPINAHVCNPIKGVSMSTVLLAQKAVALEACKVLHNAGELDDHFMPIGKEMVKYAEELDSWPDEKSLVPGRPGTTKRRQTYEKQIPAALSDCLPTPDAPLFLYEIEMKLKTRLPDGLNVRRRRLHAPEETTRCFGILTAKPLPPILGFPIFTRSGEESVRIRLCRSFISLGEHHIKVICSFHHYIFSDMLRIDRVPLTFRPDSSQMQIFVVILDKPNPANDLDIDWRFMCEVASKRRIDDRMRSDPWFRHRVQEAKGGKKVFVFNRSKYEDGVVIAKYRSPDQPNRFYVAEIKDELDPYSSFPSSEYESFHHYYRIKYGLNICCLNQPLLDVDHTSSRLNLLTPRYMNQKGKVLPVSSLEKKRAKYETLTNRQILVPELCDLHPIPASLWRKAVCIPSIIYRLSSILLAEELRRKIFEESRIGQETLPLGCDWPDLDFGWENDQSEEDESEEGRITCNAAGDAKCGCGEISNENHLRKSEPGEMTNLEVNASGDAPSKRVDLSNANPPQKAEIGEAGRMADMNAAGDASGKNKVLSNVDTPHKPVSGEVTDAEGNAADDVMSKSVEISRVDPPKKSENGESGEITDVEEDATGVATSESGGISKVDLSEKSKEVANMESAAGDDRGESTESSKGDPCQNSESGEMIDEERNSSGSTTTDSEEISNIDLSGKSRTLSMHPEQTSGVSDSSENPNSEAPNITNGELGSVKNGNHSDSNGISCENEPKSVTTNSSDSELDFDYESDEFQHHFHISGDETTPKKRKFKKPRAFGNKKFTLGVISRELIQNMSTSENSSTKNKFTGPSPGLILQALTLSNASDGFNLERLEMLGDSFLKHAVTVYLFCTYPDAHEGKLSYMRSKKVSNYNLYRIGQQRKLPGKMTALIFDPAVNWLPPGYVIGTGNHTCDDDDIYKDTTCDSLDDEMEIGVWTGVPGQKVTPPKPEKTPEKTPTPKPAAPTHSQDDRTRFNNADVEEEGEEIFDEDEIQMIDNMLGGCLMGGVNGFRGGSSHSSRSNGFSSFTGRFIDRNVIIPEEGQNQRDPGEFVIDTWTPVDADGKPLCATDPLLIDLHTQQSLADKSVADCVEAILGAYLTTCGHRAAQLLLCYFGLKVLPRLPHEEQQTSLYGFLKLPTNVLLDESPSGYRKLELFTKDLTAFEKKINYTFKNKAYLLQAFTHASYYLNTITDCYQRLEFLGDAILDFLITCRLFNDPSQRHSPGALTDLRSALVNNTIFASLAVRHDFHKYFKAISPELHHIIGGFVRYQHLQEEAQGMDAQLAKRYYPTTEDSGIDDLEDIIVAPDAFIDQDDGEEEEEEDVEVPKALGDIFESVAGAIYMDSGMNLDEVWRVYEPMMGPLIEKFSSCVPRAPVRELLEMEPETAKFSWAEKRCDGKVRVTVEVIGKGSFKGIGRSYRIAKSAAARRALRFLKSQDDDCCN